MQCERVLSDRTQELSRFGPPRSLTKDQSRSVPLAAPLPSFLSLNRDRDLDGQDLLRRESSVVDVRIEASEENGWTAGADKSVCIIEVLIYTTVTF